MHESNTDTGAAPTTPGRGLTVSRLLSLASLERRRLIIGTLFLFIGSAAGLVFPALARQIIDGALEAGDSSAVDRATAMLLVVFAVQGVAVALRYYLFTAAGEQIVVRLRGQVYEAILRQEIAFFDKRMTGELTNRLSADAGVLQNTVSVNISMALRHALTAGGGMLLLVATSPSLGLSMLVVVPLLVGATLYFGRMIRRISHAAQEELANAGEIAEEAISTIRTVRVYGREGFESERYGGALGRYFDAARSRIVATAWFSGFVTMFGYGTIAVVLWYGGRLVLDGTLTVGDLMQFVLYTLLVATSIAALGTLYADFMKARGAAVRIFELLDREHGLEQRDSRRPEVCAGDIRLRDVRFTYPTRQDVEVLKDVDLTLSAGSVTALVGRSGGGKSTLAALVQRFYDPTSGTVTLDGEDYRDIDPEWLRSNIAVVAQDPVLRATTIAENIRYGRLDATDDEIRAASVAANAHRFILSFPDGYKTVVGERGVQLSGGQRQRVAIARALVRDPSVLVLDEATSALDAESEHLVQEALNRLMQGRTVLLIAHRLSTVMNADRIVVVDNGQIIEEGTGDELLAMDGEFRALVERQLNAD